MIAKKKKNAKKAKKKIKFTQCVHKKKTKKKLALQSEAMNNRQCLGRC